MNRKFQAAKKNLAKEEKKLEAGKPNKYNEAYRNFCKAQREAGL